MALTTVFLNGLLDGAGVDQATHMSLHTSDPGATGANEATGGSYARKAITWGAASGGVATASPLVFDVESATITHVGLWAVDGTTWLGGGATSTQETFGAAGVLTVDPADLNLTSPA
ncbi:phage tail fiber protein [Nocardiopsis lucentensis]|uniref:phage tail fiber protein n=1 Tax=Nocardiopsis lucentensis TaxID=53441 RepID=UPI0003463EC4|nr:hypothetical protein [Nocardiopsis lucentensis]